MRRFLIALLLLTLSAPGTAQDNGVVLATTHFSAAQLAPLLAEFGPVSVQQNVTGADLILAEVGSFSELEPSPVTVPTGGLFADLPDTNAVPWAQATYVMAANIESLVDLPPNADLFALTYDQLAAWGMSAASQTGRPVVGLPVGGRVAPLTQGVFYPAFTGGTVTTFAGEEAGDMYAFLAEDLWPLVTPTSERAESTSTMLFNGEALIALDHTASLRGVFERNPDRFIAFPVPAGPAGRGVLVETLALGIPEGGANPSAAALIDHLTSDVVQSALLETIGYFPVTFQPELGNLPEADAILAGAVYAQITAPDAIPAVLPVGLGNQRSEFDAVYARSFQRFAINGESGSLRTEAETLQSILEAAAAPCWPPDPVTSGICSTLIIQ